MSQDNKVIDYLSQTDLLALMRETRLIAIQDTGSVDGKPVIHALLKIINAQTGAELPGGLPFSVIMFKAAAEAGYSNIAIGTVVPAVELGIELPANFFNLSNQRFRFIRAFPLDATSFVLQMDLFVRNATGEYLKFSFGLWAAMFSQVLFELMGRGTDAPSRAAEIYARTNIVDRMADAIVAEPPAASEEAPVEPLPEAPAADEPSPVTEEVTAVTQEAASAPESEAVEPAAPAAETANDTTPDGEKAQDEPAAKAEAETEAAVKDASGDAAEKKDETPSAATAEKAEPTGVAAA